MKIFLNDNVIHYIANRHYKDLNVSSGWDELLMTSLKNNDEDTISRIEGYADNGIINLHRLIDLNRSLFSKGFKCFMPIQLPSQQHELQWLSELCCCLHNCMDLTTKKPLSQLSLNDVMRFFYSDEMDDILDLVIKEHPEEVAAIYALISSSQPNKKNAWLRELLIFPFIMADADMKLASKNFDDIFYNALPNVGKYAQELNYQWLRECKADHQCAILGALCIFYLIKNIYTLCGSKKVFGYYQRLFDVQMGNVLYSSMYHTQNFLIRGNSTIITGQANIDEVEIIPDRKLLINFQHSIFYDTSINNQIGFSTALVIENFYSDISASFEKLYKLQNNEAKITLLLESSYDYSPFTEIVKEQLFFLDMPRKFIQNVPPFKYSAKQEKERYLSAPDILSSSDESEAFITERLKSVYALFLSPKQALQNVKIIELKPGEVLVNEGDPSNFVYIPLDDGLEGFSQTNKIRFYPKAWMLVAHISVIQQSKRTATISATKKIKILMIPGIIYMRFWHVDYSIDELKKIIEKNNQ